MRKALLAAATLLIVSGAAADDVPKPMHGGRAVHAGAWHVELVTKDTVVDVYLADHDNKPVSSTGFKAVAILMVSGKAQRIPLSPAGEARLTGTAASALPNPAKGAVQITAPNGKSANAKFD